MSDDGVKSLFNAGIALAERIDSLQRALNASRFNLRGFNQETGTFNYEVMINALDGLLLEAWAKLDKQEKIDAERVRKLTHDCINHYPPMEQSGSERSGSSGFKMNQKNFDKLKNLLLIYEKKMKEYLDEHALNSPNRDDDEGL